MNADEFKELYQTHISGVEIVSVWSTIDILARGIEEILRRLDEQEEFRHDQVDIGTCACGRMWPHA